MKTYGYQIRTKPTYESYRYSDRYRAKSSRGGMWDQMVRGVCIGCNGTLNHSELKRNLAFCYSCRRVLFPETIEYDHMAYHRSKALNWARTRTRPEY